MADQPPPLTSLDLRTDCEIMSDGTRRWLWRVIHRGRLYSAGIGADFQEAYFQACFLCGELSARLTHSQPRNSRSALDAIVADLTKLEDDPPVREIEGEKQGDSH